MLNFSEIRKCRLCGNPDLDLVLDLGNSPVTSYFPLLNETDPYSTPLELVICNICTLIQLKHNTDINFLFGNTYGYRTSLNPTMKSHVEKLSDWLFSRVNLNLESAVLDIGSNDGTFLNKLGDKVGIKVGIDPNCNDMIDYYNDDIEVIADFFSADKVNCKFKLITSIAMFYDVDDPISFAQQIKSILDIDGYWFLEQSYVLDMLQNYSFDTICQEHLMYYSLTSLSYVMDKADLEIVEVKPSLANGGSMGILVTHKNLNSRENELVQIFKNEKIQLNQLVEKFKVRVPLLKESLNKYLNNIKLNGAIIWCIGASTKGNTILNYLGLDNKTITGIADKNPMKVGRVTPGSRIPIYPAGELAKSSATHALVLPWHFRDFIIEDESDFLRNGGVLIFPVPSPEEVRKNSITKI